MAARIEDLSVESRLRKLRVSYTKDYLLSLAGLDTCRNLPRGFDLSVLREFDDALTGLTQLSGDSDHGRSYGNLSQCPWPKTQHDGILGSHFSLKASETKGDCSVPTSAIYNCLLKRSGELYHPHLTKATTIGNFRKGTHDSYSDEIFGASKSSNQERADVGKRRDSLELKRKEKEKAALKEAKVKSDEFEEIADDENRDQSPLSMRFLKSRPSSSLSFTNSQIEKKTEKALVCPPRNFHSNVKADCIDGHTLYPLESSHQPPEEDKASGYLYSGDKLTHEDIMKPFMLEVNKISSTQHHSLPSVQKGQITTSLPSRTGVNDLVSFSNKNTGWFSGCLPRDIRSNNGIPSKSKGNVGNFYIKSTPERKCAGLQVELQSSDLQIMLEGSVEIDTQDDIPRPYSYHCSDPLAVDICGYTEFNDGFSYIKNNHEGFLHSSGGKKPGFLKEIVESKFVYDKNFSGFNSKTDLLDKICLPDEENLITIDDFIVPEDGDFLPVSKASETDVLDFSIAIEMAEELLASDDTFGGNDRSCQLEPGSFNIFGGTRSSETDYSLYAQQFDQWFHQSQTSPETALYNLDPQQPQVSSKLVPVDFDIYAYNRLRHGSFTRDTRFQSFDQCNELSGFGYHCSHPHQLHQRRSNGLPRDALFQHRINKMACSALKPNPLHDFLLRYQQLEYGGFGMPKFDHAVGGNSKEAKFGTQIIW